MRLNKIFLVLAGIIFLANFILAVPQLTINSPQSLDYNSTKILLNVTSNEPVDLFIKTSNGKNTILTENASEFISYLYNKEGNYEFTIWANNSNGETNATVNYNSTMHNPVYIDSCGYLYSSDTAYILQNNVNADNNFHHGFCISMGDMRNITFDLNGYTISASETYNQYRRALMMNPVSDARVFNGTINGSATEHSGGWTELITLDVSRTKFSNLNISALEGFQIWGLDKVIFENVNINSSVGMFYYSISDVYFINSSFTWNGYSNNLGCAPSAFCDLSYHSEIFLEETNITGFPEYDFYLWGGSFSDFYLRNTNLNLSRVRYPDWITDARFFTQHKILIDVTDQFNETGSGVVEIKDNSMFENAEILDTLKNPTDDLLIATDENGTAEVWVTEKLTYAKSSSPAVINEYDFSNYTLTAKTWDVNETLTLNLTGHHSTIPVSFTLEIPQALSKCTILQMLDLNNDGNVDTQDALIIIRYKVGHPVSEQSTSKSCEGINLNPF